jgi:hypothetical protein
MLAEQLTDAEALRRLMAELHQAAKVRDLLRADRDRLRALVQTVGRSPYLTVRGSTYLEVAIDRDVFAECQEEAKKP